MEHSVFRGLAWSYLRITFQADFTGIHEWHPFFIRNQELAITFIAWMRAPNPRKKHFTSCWGSEQICLASSFSTRKKFIRETTKLQWEDPLKECPGFTRLLRFTAHSATQSITWKTLVLSTPALPYTPRPLLSGAFVGHIVLRAHVSPIVNTSVKVGILILFF